MHLDIKDVEIEKVKNAVPFPEWEERVIIVPDSGDMFDIFYGE